MFFLSEYTYIGYYGLIWGGLAGIILVFAYLLGTLLPDTEKLSTYGYGFDPYEDARYAFDARFYLVAILFIIFDIETISLFPWGASLWLKKKTPMTFESFKKINVNKQFFYLQMILCGRQASLNLDKLRNQINTPSFFFIEYLTRYYFLECMYYRLNFISDLTKNEFNPHTYLKKYFVFRRLGFFT